MIVEGFRGGTAETMDAFQYFYDENGEAGLARAGGDVRIRPPPRPPPLALPQFVRYSIVDATTNEVVRSFKQSFCLAPTDAIDLTVPGALFLPYLPEMSSVCGGEEARWLREALPAGWGDTYYQFVAGQAFNITTLPNGAYKIRVDDEPTRPPQGSRRPRTTSKTATSSSSDARATAR